MSLRSLFSKFEFEKTIKQMTPQQIDEILWYEWDPIGVNVYEEARDEYYSYLPQAFDLKISGANKETIATALFKIETETMCLSGNMEHCREVAGKIVEL